jgi:hypothetical protein
MPGKIYLYYLLGMFTNVPEALGILTIVVSSLGGALLYLAVRWLFGDRRTALYALALYLLVPAKIYFYPILNTVAPVPILAAFLLHVAFLRTRRWYYAVGLGATLFLVVFFEPLPLTMGILFAAVLGAALVQRQLSWRDAARLVALSALGFVLLYVLMRLIFHYDLWWDFRRVLNDANSFNETARRRYDIWVRQNLLDFVLGAGVGAVILGAIGLIAALATRRGSLLERLLRPAVVWGLAIVATLAYLDLAGVNRGEVIRLWIFLACFLQVMPAWLLAQTSRTWPFALVAAGMVLQAELGSAMMEFI